MVMKSSLPATSAAPALGDEGTPVSVKIRERLVQSRKRFHANDNIAEFIQPGELEALLDEVEEKMRGVLGSLVIDTENDHNTANTARRVAKMYLNEVFRGRYVPAPAITEFPNAEHLNALMIVGPITVRSACSHHFCPIMGRLWVGVMPNEHSNLIGLSKYARLAEWVMSRPQIQEEAIAQMQEAFGAYGRALEESGVLIAAEVLAPTASATTTLRPGPPSHASWNAAAKASGSSNSAPTVKPTPLGV